MPRQSLSTALLALALFAAPAAADDVAQTPAAPPAPAAPAERKLAFNYPCAFAYSDGPAYEDRLSDWVCDYVHASVRGGRKTFNDLPTLAAQKSMLADVERDADNAHDRYVAGVGDLLKKTDPAKIPKNLTPAQRLDQIHAMQKTLSRGIVQLADPFLWPARAETTYVEKTPGWWPSSWKPYIHPAYARFDALNGEAEKIENGMIDATSAALDHRLRQGTLSRTAEGLHAPGQPEEVLNRAFDGQERSGVVSASPAPGAPAAPAPGLVLSPPIRPGTDLQAAPPPAPIPRDPQEREQRNYFARGTTAGAQRLKDDATIAVWHAFGQTTTVGDPVGVAPLIVHQEGPSCGVGAQYEALRARGQDADIAKLAIEARDKGYYVDYGLNNGSRTGGTMWSHMNSLMTDRGVPSRIIPHGSSSDIVQSIRASGGAIVFVGTRAFWSDASQPAGANHFVYVTGAEVDRAGAVRGYYVNDTGTGEAVRFISAADFSKAWRGPMVAFAGAPTTAVGSAGNGVR